MAEDVLGVFPASEIWGLNRKRSCTLLLSDHRLLVLQGANRRRRTRMEEADVEALEGDAAYALPLEEVRWIQVNPSLLGPQIKVQTAGGSYRFGLRRRHLHRLERSLRGVLGDRVRRPGEY